ncbi:ABC transporter permease [Catellatospora citrea]|uniref:ABC transporter permease n=1 Tax=Catellatospora citrea TaxID=53366 RepID=UPI0033F082F7
MMYKLVELILIAAREIATRKARALLACLSLVIGILAVIFVQATAGATRAELIHLAELRQGRIGTAVVAVDPTPYGSRRAYELAESSGTGADVAALLSDTGTSLSGTRVPVPVLAYAGNLRAIHPFDIVSGAWPSRSEQPDGTIVINKAARQQLGPSFTLTWSAGRGDRDHSARLAAVVEDGNSDPRAYLPWATLREHAAPIRSSRLVLLTRTATGDADTAMRWLRAQTAANQLPAHEFSSVNAAGDIDATLRVVYLAFLGVSAIMLLVGIMAVLNIGLATLKQRAEELALRRSLGATKTDIGILVLAESVMIGLAGSALAVVLSVAAYGPVMALVAPGVPDLGFPTDAALTGIAAGAMAGAVAGLIPAIRAARTPIATVMRA